MTDPDTTADVFHPDRIYVRTVAAYIDVPHELLVDSGGHICDEHCPPPHVPPRRTVRQRVRARARRAWWALRRVGGLRLVHRDRVDRDLDD